MTLEGIVTLFRLLQLEKGEEPIVVTPSGIVTLVRLLQFLKGELLIEVIPVKYLNSSKLVIEVFDWKTVPIDFTAAASAYERLPSPSVSQLATHIFSTAGSSNSIGSARFFIPRSSSRYFNTPNLARLMVMALSVLNSLLILRPSLYIMVKPFGRD